MINANDRIVRQVIEWTITGLLVIVTAFAVAYFVQAKANYRDCVDRNFRAVATDRALRDLAEAMASSGDPKEAQAVRAFMSNRRDSALPECTRPPFTKQHIPGE